MSLKGDLLKRLQEIDKKIDEGNRLESVINERSSKMVDLSQKAKIKWSIEGDENSKYYHCMLNKKRRQVSLKGVKVDGEWVT
uniref:RNA-directed DNA polymerase, eukaryota n=1 Tax=Lactuca sativa TaxID=4236 RepID=A0A9R1W9U3_LACSA|nr:hypothetical protein LSAT_V11C300133850 [Lactuca sativa]